MIFLRTNKENLITVFLLLIMASAVFNFYQPNVIATFMPTTKKVIVIDAGHGGWDPGKVGINGQNEKDLNLQISEKLQAYLEGSGAQVIITRNDDAALSNKKREDLKLRKNISNESNGHILISIHQNSFPKQSAAGAQVFYHNSSESGKKLASHIQDELKKFADPSNKRGPKANTDYYILKTTEIPAVIVECGFISNPEEESKLNQEDYQEKIAWSIYMGNETVTINLDKDVQICTEV